MDIGRRKKKIEDKLTRDELIEILGDKKQTTWAGVDKKIRKEIS